MIKINRAVRTRAATIGIALLLVVAGMSAPVAANPIGDVFGDDDEEDESLVPDVDVDAILGGVDGIRERTTSWIERQRGTAPESEEVASNVSTTFNDNSGAILEYVNERSVADSDERILRLEFVLDGEESTRYLVSEVNESTENYTDATIVDSEEFESRGLDESDVDEEVRLEGIAAQRADEELETFVEDYVETGDDPSSRYLGRLGTQYAGSVDASFNW